MSRAALLGVSLTLAGCCTPTTVTKTVTETVQVPVVVAIPAALAADCVPEPLAGSTVGAMFDRLASVEAALSVCRAELATIRALPAR